MDNLQFLDITGLEADEIQHINSCLSETPKKISLPWTLKKKSCQKIIREEPKKAEECNGTSMENYGDTQNHVNYPSQMTYYGVHYNPNQLPPMVSYVPNYQHPSMYSNYHPPQMIQNADTAIHFMYQPNQMYNYTQVPVTYQNHPSNAQYCTPVVHNQKIQEAPVYNGISDKKPFDGYVQKHISHETDISNDIPTTNMDSSIPEPVTSTAEVHHEITVPSVEIVEKIAPKLCDGEIKDEVIPIIVENCEIPPKTDPIKVASDSVKENGIKFDNSAPANVWAKKPGVSLFKKDTLITNGELLKSDNARVKSPEISKASTNIDPVTYRLGELLSNFKIDGKPCILQPRGLMNRSNYCYINSILQALLACPPLCNLLIGLSQTVKQNENGKRLPMTFNMCELISKFEKLPESLHRSKRNKKRRGSFEVPCGDPFEASSFYTILNGTRSDSFLVEGRQEDAEEFLGLLLNGLNDEMMNVIKSMKENDPSSDKEINQDSDDWKVMGAKNKGNITRKVQFDKTPISDIFGGLLCSKIHKTGDETTVNIQPFLTLQLNIEKANTIAEALEQLTIKNQLEGLTSSKTNEKVDAWQQVLIEELPAVLVLHLKCFDYKWNGCTKIMKMVDFPIDLQIDSKILSGKTISSSEKQYKLFAVVYHEGKEASKGHYVADTFHSGYSTWLRFDDAKIKSVSEESVLKPQGYRVPYLLFYKRCDLV